MYDSMMTQKSQSIILGCPGSRCISNCQLNTLYLVKTEISSADKLS